MKGNNSLRLCTAEMLVAVQEYLDKRMGSYAPEAWSITFYDNVFTILLKEPEQKEDDK